jgi:solute carrier family 44 protein 1 (choline transporter-like protein)
LVIRLFAESQKALIAQPGLFLIPIATFLVLTMFLSYWILASFMIYSFDTYDTSYIIFFNIKIDRKILTNIIWAYHFIALIWISQFILGCQSMVITGSVAKWYFTREKSQFTSSIFNTIINIIVFNMGSIALGSFLITLIKIPRYILMWLQDKFKASGNSTVQYLSKACICCFWCLEKFMKFINSNAYTIIMIEGCSFCTAAQKAFSIVVENSVRMATINSVGDFMLFLAKVTVSALTLALGNEKI